MKQDRQDSDKMSRTKVTMTQRDRGQRPLTAVTGERFGGFCVVITATLLQRSHLVFGWWRHLLEAGKKYKLQKKKKLGQET